MAWALIATLLNLGLRLSWPAYAAVEKQMEFTLGMLAARLAIGALASAGAGLVAAWISRRKTIATWVLVILLLAMFLPFHYMLWQRFPAWYHAVFLLSLVIVPPLGARLR